MRSGPSAHPCFPQPPFEAGTFGGAADQPDMGNLGIAQSGIGYRQIQGMAVAHDEHETSGRRVLQFRNWMKGLDESDISGHGARKGGRARIDPNDLEGQWRQCQDQRAANMPGHRIDKSRRGFTPKVSTTSSAWMRPLIENGPSASRFASSRMAERAPRSKLFDRPVCTRPPAALAKFGPKRMVGEFHGRAGHELSLGKRDGPPFQCAAADGSRIALRRDKHAGAGIARRRPFRLDH